MSTNFKHSDQDELNNTNEEKKEDETLQVSGTEVKMELKAANYVKICEQFGCDLVTNKLLERYEKLTGAKAHPLIKRGLYYAHRDFDKILDAYEKGEPFYLYTGRGPSSESMHLGHMIPFIINKHLQEAFNVPLVIQITDDEKYFYKDSIKSIEKSYEMAIENIKDIIAIGFDITKTFIFIDTDYIGYMYRNVCKVQEKTQYNTLKSLMGFNEEGTNVGKIAYPPIQAVPAFSSTFKIPFNGRKMRCLIPCAIDQDPYFRLTRDVGPKIGEYKCATLYSKFIPGLRGPKGKMSASEGSSAIYLNDDPKQIRNKIKKYAFSGGQETKELQKQKGANLEIDVSYQYLTFFLEDDDKLDDIAKKYEKGDMMTGEVKNELCNVLIPIIERFQKNRKLVDDNIVKAFTTVRPLNF